MALAKRFKLKFPNIPSFQLCRLKSPSSLPKNPKPANCRLLPVNPKAFNINYPSLPAPPPPSSTPDCSFVITSTKIKSNGSESCRSRSCGQYSRSDSSTEFPRSSAKTTSFETSEKFHLKQKKHKESKKKVKGSALKNEAEEDEDDSLVLLDSYRSFSNDQLDPIGQSVPSNDGAIRERSRWNSERKPAEKAREVRRGSEKASSCRERVEPEGHGQGKKKVRESFAVVKKSEDPYEDFKRSMLEMIMGKQMFEASDLEELLQCFLTLNSQQYHGVIVEAFSEIWEILFCDSHVGHRLSF